VSANGKAARKATKGDKPRGGYPSLLTKDREEKLVDLLQRGHWVSPACAAVGISRTTFYEWRALGIQDPKSKYGKFLEKVNDAVAFAEARAIHVISTEADSNAEMMLKFMRIRHRKRWGENRLELTGKDGAPIQVESKIPDRMLRMSMEELKSELLKELRDLPGEDPDD
jgi:hypothetical protein